MAVTPGATVYETPILSYLSVRVPRLPRELVATTLISPIVYETPISLTLRLATVEVESKVVKPACTVKPAENFRPTALASVVPAEPPPTATSDAV